MKSIEQPTAKPVAAQTPSRVSYIAPALRNYGSLKDVVVEETSFRPHHHGGPSNPC